MTHSELNYVVPPECQGQIIEVAYVATGEWIYRRTTDRSTRAVTYEQSEWPNDDSFKFEPQNSEPDIADWEICFRSKRT